MKHALATALMGLALTAPVSAAFADDDDDRYGFKVTRAEAIAIAEANGMYYIEEIERDDGKWELEGCTADRREIEIDIHGQTGRILELEIDDYDDDC